jgi:hypothetical protein
MQLTANDNKIVPSDFDRIFLLQEYFCLTTWVAWSLHF